MASAGEAPTPVTTGAAATGVTDSGHSGEDGKTPAALAMATPATPAATMAPAAKASAPVAASASIVRGSALSRALAAAVDRAVGLRRRAGRATTTAAAKAVVGSGDAARATGTTCNANDKEAGAGVGAEAGGEENKKDDGEKEEGKNKNQEDENEEDEEKEDEEKDEPLVSSMGALRAALPWVVPRTYMLRALLVVAVTAEVACNACAFVRPLLLRYAMDGLAMSSKGAADAASAASSGTVDAVALGAVSSRVPAAVIERLLRLLPAGLVPSAAYQRPLVAIVGYICSGYLAGTLSYVQWLSWSRAEQALTRDIQTATFAHLHGLSLKWHLNRNSSRVMHIFYDGVRSVTDLFELVSFEFFPVLTNFVMNLTVLWRLGSWRLSVLAAVAVGAYISFSYAGTRLQMGLRRKAFKADAREAGRAMDSLHNFENVKVFATEAVEVRRYSALRARQDARRDRSLATFAFISNGQSLIQSLFVAAGLVMVGRQVLDGTLSVADFVAAQTYLNRVFDPVKYASYSVRRYHSALLSLRKLVDIHQQRPDVVDASDATPLVLCPTPTSKGGRVCFERVSFAYGADSAGALYDISFTVPAGKTTAIVGATGSGKSTLLRLLLRLFDVSAGRITIDGQDVAHVTQQSLRDAIGVVPQDCHLLRDSVRTNIAYGRAGGEGVTDEAVMAAVDVAQLADWVGRLPKGLSSICGERGVLLSGGERQRVAIARAVVRSPAVMVLDESSSSLDSETERAMQSSLRSASAGTTTLVVAHRLSTVMGADEILVLHGGRIVERGSHEELRRIDGGRYQRMWELQHGDGGDAAAAQAVAAGASGAAGAEAAASTDGAVDGSTPVANGDGVVVAVKEVAAAGEAIPANGGLPAGGVVAAAAGTSGAACTGAKESGADAASLSAVADGAACGGHAASPPSPTVGS